MLRGTTRRGSPTYLIEGCRFAVGEVDVSRRVRKQFGKQTGVDPVRDFAIPVVGIADGDLITDGDLAFGGGVEIDIGAISAPPVPADRVVTTEERNEGPSLLIQKIC